MDRDAPAPPPPDLVPPVEWDTARKVGFIGVGIVAGAAALGLVATALGDGSPALLSTLRLVLVFVGAIVAGVGVSLRSDLWQAWAIGSAAAVLGIAGLPAHWDSFRFLFAVLAVIGVARLLLILAPPHWRVRVISAFILFHFGGIFLATTSPPPTPWLVDQLYNRIYTQYLQFTYLRNAYHFYSPEPGPASLLVCSLKTEIGEETTADGVKRKKYELQWIALPRRPADIRDPLGLTYYRRLSITDQISRGMPDMASAAFEKTEMWERRNRRSFPGGDATAPTIPFLPGEPYAFQYRLPTPEVARFLLPSYAQHMLLEHTPDPETAARTTLKIYRVEHRTLGVAELTGKGMPNNKPNPPYHPATYRPYFLGEFKLVSEDPTDPRKPRVELLDPQADMLYWLVPIVPRTPSPTDANRKDYDDYMSLHAGHEFDWSILR